MLGVKLIKMNNSSPQKLILASLFLALVSIKIKEQCYYCFLGALIVGLLFLFYGIYKLIKKV